MANFIHKFGVTANVMISLGNDLLPGLALRTDEPTQVATFTVSTSEHTMSAEEIQKVIDAAVSVYEKDPHFDNVSVAFLSFTRED